MKKKKLFTFRKTFSFYRKKKIYDQHYQLLVRIFAKLEKRILFYLKITNEKGKYEKRN